MTPDHAFPLPHEAGRVTAAELSRVELFADADAAAVRAVAAQLARRHHPAGEVILREGDTGRSFFVVLSGEVRVSRADGVPHRLGTGGPGGIYGELSAITGRPRRATVTAATDVVTGVGDPDVFGEMLAADGVARRLIELAATRLAELARPVRVTLDDGTVLAARPLLARDREGFSAALARQPSDWIQHRFFSAVKPSPALVDYLVEVDYVDHFAWLVGREEPLEGVGVGRFIRSVQDPSTAELAFEVADPWRGRGVGTFLLGAVAVAGRLAGVERLHAEVLRENQAMRAVLSKVGASWHHDEPGVVQTEIRVAAAERLLAPRLRAQLGTVVEEIVTAAGLALG